MELLIVAVIALGATAAWGIVVLIDFLRPVKKTARKLKKMMYMARSVWDELDEEKDQGNINYTLVDYIVWVC